MNIALIVAAGKGNRCNNKLFQKANGHPILFFALKAFEKHVLMSQIVVMARKKDQKAIRMLVRTANFVKVSAIIEGDVTRQQSMEKGFRYYQQYIQRRGKKKPDMIIVHNGANPLVSEQEITNVIHAAEKYGTAVCAQTMTDTVREVKNGFSAGILKRESLAIMQTPQAIRADWLALGLAQAKKDGFIGTDDVSLVERIGKAVRIVPANHENKKITYPSDVEYVRYAFEKQSMESKPHDDGCRVGIGEDSHVFSKKKGLILGGAYFPQYQKLQANSDGDVMLHALFNAISGAIGEGSIGKTADKMLQKKKIQDSKKYIEHLLKKVEKKGLKLTQISFSIEAKIPKIDPLTALLKKNISKIVSLSHDAIGITATSGEELTPFGRGKAIRCMAIAHLGVVKKTKTCRASL